MKDERKWNLADGITLKFMPYELFRIFSRSNPPKVDDGGELIDPPGFLRRPRENQPLPPETKFPTKLIYLNTNRVQRSEKLTKRHMKYTSLVGIQDEFGVDVNLVVSSERQLWEVLEEQDWAQRKLDNFEEDNKGQKFADLKRVISKAFVHDGTEVVVAPEYDAAKVMVNWCRLIGAYCLYLLAQRDQMGKIGFPYHSGLLSFFIRSMNLSTTTLREIPGPYRSVVAIDLIEALSILIEDARYTDFCGAVMGTVARFSKAFPELNELIIEEANKRKPKAVVDEDLDITAFVRRMMKLNSD